MNIQFRQAKRNKAKLRLALIGAPGSGKTYSALRIAKGLGGKTAMIDTEAGSGDLYATDFDYSIVTMNAPYETDKYIAAIKAAQEAGFDNLVIDSLSHAWLATLDKKTAIDAAGGNSFTNWAKVNPSFYALIDTILHSELNIICTIRAKVGHVIERDDKGKTIVRKLGLAPQFRDGIEYEFTAVLDVSDTHTATASKDRTGLFDGRMIVLDGQVGKDLNKWLNTETPRTELDKAVTEMANNIASG